MRLIFTPVTEQANQASRKSMNTRQDSLNDLRKRTQVSYSLSASTIETCMAKIISQNKDYSTVVEHTKKEIKNTAELCEFFEAHLLCCDLQEEDSSRDIIVSKEHCKIEKKTTTRRLSLTCKEAKSELDIIENDPQNSTDECSVTVITEIYFLHWETHINKQPIYISAHIHYPLTQDVRLSSRLQKVLELNESIRPNFSILQRYLCDILSPKICTIIDERQRTGTNLPPTKQDSINYVIPIDTSTTTTITSKPPTIKHAGVNIAALFDEDLSYDTKVVIKPERKRKRKVLEAIDI